MEAGSEIPQTSWAGTKKLIGIVANRLYLKLYFDGFV
jgi:hypothetical protein